ncbi:MAG: flagellum-specific ATP synthase FliI, partial [Rhizobiaceae bacterium]|nr:flagellum-specific ATP synthase FliI [Rhizobiaceae bacterium]
MRRPRQTPETGALTDPRIRISGHIVDVSPQAFRVAGLSPFVRLGDCVISPGPEGDELGEVVRIEENAATVKPFAVRFQSAVRTTAWRTGPITLAPTASWKGRTVDAFGRPCDDLGPLEKGPREIIADTLPDAAMKRGRIREAVKTNVKAIDIFTPIIKGQRLGIFAGSGVGKSTLMGMLARAKGFDTIVVALVGERGREVREFLEETMQNDLSRLVTVVATGDESPMMRRLAPKTAMSIAEYFRDQGDHVLLIVDSVTRLAHAARDVA